MLQTGDAQLAEASPSDCEWGIGFSIKQALLGKAWRGNNLLGQADKWATAYQSIDRSIDQANVLNLDRRSVMLEAFRQIEQVERSQLVA